MHNGTTPVPCYIPGKLHGTVDSKQGPRSRLPAHTPCTRLHPCTTYVTSRALGSLHTIFEIMFGTILGARLTGGR